MTNIDIKKIRNFCIIAHIDHPGTKARKYLQELIKIYCSETPAAQLLNYLYFYRSLVRGATQIINGYYGY